MILYTTFSRQSDPCQQGEILTHLHFTLRVFRISYILFCICLFCIFCTSPPESNFTHLYFAHAHRVTDTDKESVAVTDEVDGDEKNFERHKNLQPSKVLFIRPAVSKKQSLLREEKV